MFKNAPFGRKSICSCFLDNEKQWLPKETKFHDYINQPGVCNPTPSQGILYSALYQVNIEGYIGDQWLSLSSILTKIKIMQ